MKMSESPKTLVAAFDEASKNPDKLRGWKRSLTLYCKRKEEETGTPAIRFLAAVKMRLTKEGFNAKTI